jgi:hypothetical protein
VELHDPNTRGSTAIQNHQHRFFTSGRSENCPTAQDTIEFIEQFISISPNYDASNEVLLVSNHQNNNFIFKIILNRDRLNNEVAILNKLDGQHHVIKLVSAYQCSVLCFGALVFHEYLTEVPMNSQRCETFAKQLMEV